MILNLQPFNKQYVDKIHFKMESLKSAISAMTPNCFLASVDLKEAFYSIRSSASIGGDKIPIYFFDHGIELLSLVFFKDLKAGLCNAS